MIGWKSLLRKIFSSSCLNGNCLVKLFNLNLDVNKHKTDDKIELKKHIKEKFSEEKCKNKITNNPFSQKNIFIKIINRYLLKIKIMPLQISEESYYYDNNC